MILQAAQAQGVPVLLVGLQATNNYGTDYKTAFDAMYPDLATEFSAILYPSFFAGITAAGGDARAAYFQDDGIHPNAAGVKLDVAAIGPSVLDLIKAVD